MTLGVPSSGAPMSTTRSLRKGVEYAESERPALLQLTTRNAMSRGACLTFLSAFPSEKEFLLPPLTYLHPVSSAQVTLGGKQLTVILVEPMQ